MKTSTYLLFSSSNTLSFMQKPSTRSSCWLCCTGTLRRLQFNCRRFPFYSVSDPVSDSVGLHLSDNTMPPGSSSALPPLRNISSQGGFSLASSNFLHPSLLPNTSVAGDPVPDFWGSQAPSSCAGCKCSVPCPSGPSKTQKFSPAEA